MTSVYYKGVPLAGLGSSLQCLFPSRPSERVLDTLTEWPTAAYWKRLAAGVTLNLDGREERLEIGFLRSGSLYIPSVVECAESGPSPDHRAQAKLAVDCIKQCEGVVLVFRSDMREKAEEHMQYLADDFARLGRRLEDVPIVLQATFQDQDPSRVEVMSPAELGRGLGIPARLCVGSIANRCIGVREALALLLSEIRRRHVQ